MNLIKNKTSLKFLSILFLSITYLVYLFKPYYFVTFDSEPDYLANAVHIIDWGIPWGGHHPGTLMQYFYSLILRVFIFFNVDLQSIIILFRVIYFSISVSIIYLTTRFILKNNKLFFYILSLIIILPLTNFHFSHFGVELILFSLCFTLWSFFYSQVYFNKFLDKTILTSIILGITVSIKFSSIILVPIYFFIIIFFFKKDFIKKFYLILKISFISFITFTICTLPSARYYPKLFNKINRQINFDSINQNEIIFIVVLISLIVLILVSAIYFYHSKFTAYFVKKRSMTVAIFFLLISILILKNFINHIDITDDGILAFYFQIPSIWRNDIPILPIYFILLFHKKINLNFYLIILFSIINISLCYSFFYGKKSYVDDLVLNDNDEKKIVFFTDSKFNSKYSFLRYTKTRYGNNKLNYPQNWLDHSNLYLLSNDIFKSWFINWVNSESNDLKKNKNILKKNKSKNENNFRNKVRSIFKSQNYEVEKFKKISLIKPTFNSRIVFDHCYYFSNSKIIFDLNNTDKKNSIFFETTIEEVENFCKINLLNKIYKNNVLIYEYK